MNRKHKQTRQGRGRGLARAAAGIALSVGLLAGCDGLLDVELPSTVTDEALEDPGSAQLQLNAIIGQIECGLSTFHYHAAGYEDNFERIAGALGNYSEFAGAPGGGNCDTAPANFDWFDPLMIGRASAFALYDRVENDWPADAVANREQILAQTALYAGVALEIFGEVFCEMALDGSELMTPDQTLATAEEWVNRALTHIANTGDFELPNGITGPDDGAGIEEFAYAIRARIRWARGDAAGALADIDRVSENFNVWVTREGRPQRRNKIYFASNPGGGYVLPAIDSEIWTNPDPSHHGYFDADVWPGEGWPETIPFTGYRNLGILPDGRALTDTSIPYPVTTDDLAAAVQDSRVETRMQQITAGGTTLYPVPVKYQAESDDMPLVSWRELKLIEAELRQGDAVELVNELRSFHNLPLVTYNPTGDEIENMIIEERRRELWLEGRFWMTKIQNPEKLWFPRDWGEWPVASFPLGGGVRLAMPESEYLLNDNLDILDRGTGCSALQAPVIVG